MKQTGEEGISEILLIFLQNHPDPGYLLNADGLVIRSAGGMTLPSAKVLFSQRLWEQHRAAAQSAGSCRVVLATGESAALSDLSGAGSGPLFLLRLAGAEDGQDPLLRLRRMAHDLRTPLQAVMITTEALSDAGLSADLQRLAHIALGRMQEILTPADRIAEIAFRDASELLQETACLFAPILQLNGNKLALDHSSLTQPLEVPAPPLRAALQNLIANANDACRNGTISLRLSADLNSSLLCVEVKDDGPGLPEAARATLLGAVPASAQGLGLRIVANAIDQLGGFIEAGHNTPTGALIRLFVPFETTRIASEAKKPEPRQGSHKVCHNQLEGFHILLIEDDEVIRDLLSRCLTDAGAQVTAEASGAAARRRFTDPAHPIELVLTDLNLPDTDGMALASELARRNPPPLVIGLTAHEDPDILAAALAAGMHLVLTKPVSLAALREVIADLRQEADGGSPLTDEAVLDPEISAALCAELGTAAAINFMARALAEAEALLDALDRVSPASVARQIEDPAIRRALHSAIGATGLTGLAGVTSALKKLQISSGARSDLPAVLRNTWIQIACSRNALASICADREHDERLPSAPDSVTERAPPPMP